MGTEDQRNSGHRGPLSTEEQREQRKQRNRGTVGTEDQRNSGYRGLKEQWV